MGSAPPLLSKVITQIVNPLIGLMFSVAAVVFIYGVVEYIRNAANDDGKMTGRRHIAWGLVGLVVMVSVYGIINLIQNFPYIKEIQ